MTRTTYIAANAEDTVIENESDAGNDEAQAFSSFQESFTGEQMGTIRVQRVPTEQLRSGNSKGSIKGVFLFSCAVDQYNYDELLTYLRDEYGTGTYRIIGVRTGNRGIAFNRILDVERPALSAQSASASPNSSSNDLPTMFNLLAQSLSQQLSRVVDTVRNAAPAVDPFEQMERMARIFATFKGEATRPPDLLGEIERIKTVAESLGMGNRGDAETTNADVFLGMVKEFGPALAKAALTGAAQSSAPSAPSAPARVPPMRPAVASPGTVGVSEMPADPREIYFRQQAKQLLLFANAGMKPGLLAQSIIDNVPEDQLSVLEEFALDPGATDKLIAMLPPGSEKHSAWFTELRLAMLVEFEAMRSENVDDAAPTG